MKMSKALEIIESKPSGYMVSFEHAGDGFLRSDYFPELWDGEKLIETEEEAWELAKKFAAKTFGKCINIYVIDNNFRPVANFKDKEIKNR